MCCTLWARCTFTQLQIPLLHAHSTVSLHSHSLYPLPPQFHPHSQFHLAPLFIIITHIERRRRRRRRLCCWLFRLLCVSCSSVSQSKLCIEISQPHHTEKATRKLHGMECEDEGESWKSNHSFFHSHRHHWAAAAAAMCVVIELHWEIRRCWSERWMGEL